MTDANTQFFAILTSVGLAKQANADALGIPWKITEMGVGDANLTDPIPKPEQTKLINEWRRRPLNQLKVDEVDPSIIIAEQVIPADEGGRWIREIGLYDEAGDLVAVANCAPSYKPLLAQGSGRTQVVRMNFIVNNSGSITLKIDPAVVLATRGYVDQAILEVLPANKTAGEYTRVKVNTRGMVVSGDNPNTLAGYGIDVATQAEAEAQSDQDNTKPMTALRVFQAIAKRVVQATETVFGWAKIATQVQTNSGADDATIVTPKKLSVALSALIIQATEAVMGIAKVATQGQTNAGTDDATIVTPKKLRWGFSVSLGAAGQITFPSWMGGLIFQWAPVGITANLGPTNGFYYGEAVATFPMAFPNACWLVLATPFDTAGVEGGAAIKLITKTGANVITQTTSAASAFAYIFAIGN